VYIDIICYILILKVKKNTVISTNTSTHSHTESLTYVCTSASQPATVEMLDIAAERILLDMSFFPFSSVYPLKTPSYVRERDQRCSDAPKHAFLSLPVDDDKAELLHNGQIAGD
jgi:hypothetical protein